MPSMYLYQDLYSGASEMLRGRAQEVDDRLYPVSESVRVESVAGAVGSFVEELLSEIFSAEYYAKTGQEDRPICKSWEQLLWLTREDVIPARVAMHVEMVRKLRNTAVHAQKFPEKVLSADCSSQWNEESILYLAFAMWRISVWYLRDYKGIRTSGDFDSIQLSFAGLRKTFALTAEDLHEEDVATSHIVEQARGVKFAPQMPFRPMLKDPFTNHSSQPSVGGSDGHVEKQREREDWGRAASSSGREHVSPQQRELTEASLRKEPAATPVKSSSEAVVSQRSISELVPADLSQPKVAEKTPQQVITQVLSSGYIHLSHGRYEDADRAAEKAYGMAVDVGSSAIGAALRLKAKAIVESSDPNAADYEGRLRQAIPLMLMALYWLNQTKVTVTLAELRRMCDGLRHNPENREFAKLLMNSSFKRPDNGKKTLYIPPQGSDDVIAMLTALIEGKSSRA